MAGTKTAPKMPPLAPGEFRFITKALESDGQSADGRRRFKTVMSSTLKDQRGDEVKMSALEQMRDAFRSGRTIFLNHSYEVPEDVFGTSDTADIIDSGTRGEDGAQVWDLHIAGYVNEPNPRAVQLWESIDGGYVKYGASIGAYARKPYARNKSGGLDIMNVDLKEGSIVGIPMNQRSWVQKAADAALAIEEDDDDDEIVADDGAPQSDDPMAKSALAGEEITVGEDGPETVTPSDPDTTKPAPEETPAADEPTAPEAGPKDEPTTGGQEADAATPETAPATEDEADPAEVQKAADIEVEDVAQLVKHVARLVEEIGKLRQENAALTDEIGVVKGEQARLVRVEEEATETIRKVMDLPLRRKAMGHVDDFVNRYPQFDPRVSAYIERATRKETE